MQDQRGIPFDMTQARDAVRNMVKILGWDQYHTPRNLVLAISLEASELLQNLQWKTEEEVNELFADIAGNRAVSDELADITINLLALCDHLGLDLNQLTVEKCAAIIKRFQNREGIFWGANRSHLRCTICSRSIKADWRYCANCGSQLIRG